MTKCSVFDCDEQGTKEYVDAVTDKVILLCWEDSVKYLNHRKMSKKVGELISKNDGRYVTINSFDEFKSRVKPEVVEVATYWVKFTSGQCFDCKERAVIMGGLKKPYCESHGFPKQVLSTALIVGEI